MRYLILVSMMLAFAVMEVFIGGARLLYAIPGVSLIALAGVCTFIPVFKMGTRANIFALVTSFFFAGYVLVRNRLSEIDYIGRLQFFIMAGCLLAYLLFTFSITNPHDRKRLFYFLMVLAVAQVALGVIQFTENNQWMPLPWAQRRDDFWRASGLFISPNHFAGYLEIVALMGISFIVWGREKIVARLLMGYVTLVCIAGIAISGSRGAYLSFTLGACVFMVLTLAAWKRLHPRRFIMIASISALVGVVLFGGIVWMMFQSQTVRDRVFEINDPENMRFLLWAAALEQFQLAPVFGTGAFSYLYFGRLFRDPSVQNDPIHVHNDYLQLLADYGVVGVILFIIFLGVHLYVGGKAFIRLVRRSGSMRDQQSDALALCIGALSIVSAYIVHSVVDFNMQLPVNAILIAVVFGILGNSSTSSEREDANRPFLLHFTRWFLPAFSVATLVYGLPLIKGEYFAERARIALRDYKLVEAFDFARKGIEAERKNPDLYYYAGEAAREMAYQKMGDSQVLGNEAIYYFTKGLEVFPYDSRLAVKLGQAHSNMGDYFEADTALALAEEWDPNSSFVFAYRGLIELAAGYLDDAEDAYRQAIELKGEGANLAREGLAITLKQQGQEEPPPSPELLEAAKQLAEQIQAQQESQPTVEDPNEVDPSTIKDINDLFK